MIKEPLFEPSGRLALLYVLGLLMSVVQNDVYKMGCIDFVTVVVICVGFHVARGQVTCGEGTVLNSNNVCVPISQVRNNTFGRL